MTDTISDIAKNKRLAERRMRLEARFAKQVDEIPVVALDDVLDYEVILDGLSPQAQLALLRVSRVGSEPASTKPRGKAGRPPDLERVVVPIYDKLKSEGKKDLAILSILKNKHGKSYASVKSMQESIRNAKNSKARRDQHNPKLLDSMG